jgi:Icc-related predicted phosphoesterase
MRIAHASDSHGRFPAIDHKGVDVIVHSGDLCPDPDISKGSKKEVLRYWQQKWVWDHIEDFKKQIDGRPFLFVAGNHDHGSGEWLEVELQKEGINAICLHDKLVSFGGLNWFGIPYIPAINGHHAYEMNEQEMRAKLLDEMVPVINASTGLDVLVCHCPPYEILDQDLHNMLYWGNKVLNEALFERIDAEKCPSLVCVGHSHSSNGVRMVSKNGRTILVSNSATTVQYIEQL